MKDVAVRTFLAVLVAVCIAIGLTEPARGDRSSGTTRGMGVGQAAAVLSLDTFSTAPATYRPGYVKVPSPHHRSAISPAVAVPTAAAVAAKLRGFVHTMEASKKPRLIQRASSLRLWIAIVEAKTPAEYHEAVRKLPVTITYSTTSDGRQVRHYEVEGKIRFEATGPTSQSVFLPVLQDVAGVPSGPFVPVQSSE